MLSSPLFRNGDIVTPCPLKRAQNSIWLERSVRMLYDPEVRCMYDDRCRSRYYDIPARIHVEHIGNSVKYYNIDIDTFGYSWTDEAFAEAQPIFRYLN